MRIHSCRCCTSSSVVCSISWSQLPCMAERIHCNTRLFILLGIHDTWYSELLDKIPRYWCWSEIYKHPSQCHVTEVFIYEYVIIIGFIMIYSWKSQNVKLSVRISILYQMRLWQACFYIEIIEESWYKAILNYHEFWSHFLIWFCFQAEEQQWLVQKFPEFHYDVIGEKPCNVTHTPTQPIRMR